MSEAHGLFDWELPSHPKWAPLTDAAFRLGVTMILWARHPERVRRRPGFVPEWMATVLSRKSKAQTAKLVNELVEAGESLHDDGIIEPAERGWMIHDFHQYGGPVLGPDPSSAKVEAGRLGGIRSVESRRAANGTAQPSKQPPASKQNAEALRSSLEAEPEANFEADSEAGDDRGDQDLEARSGDSPDPKATSGEEDPHTSPVEAKPEAAEADSEAEREKNPKIRAQVAFVFEAWKQDTGHYGALLDRKRGNRIAARLKERFTPDQLVAAIRNRRNDPHLMGTNDTGRVYDGIDTLLRDAAQVERLVALTEPLRPPARRAPPAPGGNFDRQRNRVERLEAEERRAALEAGNATK